ncbi:HD domain-containing phosphohydrolase [Chloroflexota bacterium]
MTREQEIILVVDDEDAIRQILHRRLSNGGYQCLEASNTEQALDKLRNNIVSLVILDIRMPGKSGTELLPEIKTSYPDIAVIMATANTDINIAIQCMKQGAYDYITKPFDLNEIILRVDRALEKRSLKLQINDYQQHLEDKVAEQAEKIRASFLSAIMALAYALEAKDKYTSGHSQRVADIAVAIAKVMNLPQELIEKVRLAGLLHDIGKIGVVESILNKPGRLTDDESQHIQKHSETGEHILTPIADDKEILRLVRSHHERYNGVGYPDGLKDTQIGLGARILAVADAYEAMTSERPYRKAMSDEVAYAEIERGKGTQFDPEVADAFLMNRTATRFLSLNPGGRKKNGQ